MILSLDVGNTQLYGGVFEETNGAEPPKMRFSFRKTSRDGASSDEYGLFLRSVLRENGLDPAEIRKIAICSVVPEVVYSIKSCCKKYFGLQPFILQAGARTGLAIRYRNPAEVGADRIANSIAASHLFPSRNLIVIDFGTATTFDVVTAGKEYLGGLIVPGLRISMEALVANTAKLPTVEILAPEQLVGRTTIESIQSGLYHGNLAMVRELTRQIRERSFGAEPTVVVGTGGFSRLFEGEGVFDALVPDLVLTGLNLALRMNA